MSNLGNAYGSLGDYGRQRDLLERAPAISGKRAHLIVPPMSEGIVLDVELADGAASTKTQTKKMPRNIFCLARIRNERRVRIANADST